MQSAVRNTSSDVEDLRAAVRRLREAWTYVASSCHDVNSLPSRAAMPAMEVVRRRLVRLARLVGARDVVLVEQDVEYVTFGCAS